MDQKFVFRDVSAAELRSVEGGLFGWLKDAASWVGDHVWAGLKDMAGAAGFVFGFKGTF